MKKITLFLFCAFLFAPVALLRAQEAVEKSMFPGIKKAMPAEDYEAAGLEKLSEDERERLDEFIRKYVSSTSEKVAGKAVTEAVDEAVKRQEAAPPTVIQSRIVGPFIGYNGRTNFRLENGQVWAQSQHDTAAFKKVDSPPVLILKDKIGYRMYVAGGSDLRVQRIK
jgi:hypothetical protein